MLKLFAHSSALSSNGLPKYVPSSPSEPCILFGVVVTDHRHVQREGIRATGKTEAIIAELLEAYPNGVEP